MRLSAAAPIGDFFPRFPLETGKFLLPDLAAYDRIGVITKERGGSHIRQGRKQTK